MGSSTAIACVAAASISEMSPDESVKD